MVLPQNGRIERDPAIALMLQMNAPDQWLNDLRSSFGIEPNEVEVVQTYSTPMAGVLLYMMQAATLFVFAKYFGAIASEAGKDHYHGLKSGCFQLWDQLKLVKMTVVSSGDAKVRDAEKFQLAFSINGNITDQEVLKLIFQNDSDDQTVQKGLSDFIDLLGRAKHNELSESDHKLLASCKSFSRTRVLTTDKVTGELIPADPSNAGHVAKID